MARPTLPLSGVSYGQRLSFHGVRQWQVFPAYVAPDYARVFTEAGERHPYQTVVVCYDRAVPHIAGFLDQIDGSLKKPCVRVPLDAGERLKTLDQVAHLAQRLSTFDIEEKSLMLVIGGGTLCNAAGFVAAMWHGMEQIVIPTNYTAIADVAIGSLHMVNVGSHKNRLQLYADPLAVILDPRFIETLSEGERRNGLAETIKHGIAQDLRLFEALEHQAAAGTILSDEPLFDFALRTAQLKDALMASDPFGQRTQDTLLYGHVIAHAIEPATDFTMSHGEAVSLGLLGELAFFHGAEAPLFVRVKRLLQQVGLPIRLPQTLTTSQILQHLSHMTTVRGAVAIPRVTSLGSLDVQAGQHTAEFTQSEVERTLGALTI